MNILFSEDYICYVQIHVGEVFKAFIFVNSLNTVRVFVLLKC